MELLQSIVKFKKRKEVYDVGNLFLSKKSENTSSLSVSLRVAPCNGFGDIVFAMKLATYLRDWYNCKVNIITTSKDSFVSLGENPENIYELYSPKGTDVSCRRFSRLFVRKDANITKPPRADLIFIAPLTSDMTADLLDVRTIYPSSNKLNTFFLSEYNTPKTMGSNFNTGIGQDRLGLLFTDVEKVPLELKNPINTDYCVAYVAETDTIPNLKICICGFTELVGKKYNKSDFTLITPAFQSKKLLKSIVDTLKHYVGTVVIKMKEGETKVSTETNNSTVYFRMDILPLPYKKMLSLIQDSVEDILVTGDQSITDVVSCCPRKNIFYQIAPWKEYFAKALEVEMPNRWLKSKRTSCGTLEAITYRGDYTKFKEKWDFRSLARPRLDGIFYFTAEKKVNRELKEYEENVLSTKTLESFKKRYGYNK